MSKRIDIETRWNGMSETRHRAVAQILRNFRGSPEERRRTGDYCDIAYRAGYRKGRYLRKRAEQKREKEREFRKRQPRPEHIVIETDTPFACPLCGVQIQPGKKHEHKGLLPQ